MKKFIYILIVIFSFFLVSCNEKNLEEITIEEIYVLEEETYYIYFYKDDCAKCEATLPYVIDYVESVKENENLIPLYGINLSKEENSKIYRALFEEIGQGYNKLYYVDNVRKTDLLFIAGTPSLIKIVTEDNEHVSYFCVSGRSDVVDFLSKELGKKDE